MTAEPQADAPRMLHAALEYLSLGYPVFPVCSPRMGAHRHGNATCTSVGKRPLIAWERYQTTLPTIADIRAWWGRWPDANIGMPTGRLSGIVVLDCDSGAARQLAMEKGGLDRTPAVFTGKPGGIHYWLAHPGEEVRNFARKLPGTDMRADGGYVLVPPSRHVQGADYRWVEGTASLAAAPVPPWLMDLLHGAGEREDGAPSGERLNLDDIVSGVPEGARDAAMWSLACKLRNDNVSRQYADLIVRQAARACRPVFDEAVALEKVQRAYREYEPEQVFRVSDKEAEGGATVGTTLSYPRQSFAELLAMKIEGMPCIIDGLIWEGRAHWVFSDPGTGKTLFLLAALLHIAAGRPFCGKRTKQGNVLIIEEDSPLSVLAEYGATLADIYDIPNDTPLWTNKITGLRLDGQHGYEAAIAMIEGYPERPSIILIDAAERIVPSNQYSTKELDWLTRFIQWCLSEGITVIVIDHTTKERAKKGETPPPPMARLFGARAKSAISDVMIYLEGGIGKGSIQATFAKFRGDTPPDFSIKFEPETGFEINTQRQSAKSPTEAEIMRFFNNSKVGWYSSSEIMQATEVRERTCRIALTALVGRGWLLRDGEARATRYRINPTIGGVFG